MDLFTPVVGEKLLHPNFRRLIEPRAYSDREVIADWAREFSDRDGKFVKEFQTTFNSGFWELYLFACCKHLGFRVDLTLSSPDFVIMDFLNEFCIEAVVACNAKGAPAEWETNLKVPPDPDLLLKTATIRLSNAIRSKYEKFLSSYQDLPHVRNRPFVLAVGPFEQPYFWAQNDHAIRQVLYCYDRVGENGEHLYQGTVQKPSGASIEFGLFASELMPEISAIIFSNTATFSKLHALNNDKDSHIWFSALRFNTQGEKPLLQHARKEEYQESLLDGLYVFHNPYARHPLPFAYFNHSDITQGTLKKGEKVPRYKCKHGHLIQRTAITLIPRNNAS